MDRRSLITAGLVAASGTAGAATPATSKPAAARAPEPASTPPKWALVLGGGTARGFAHIGVLKALQQGGLVPDLVVGCSAGALVGALYAAGQTPQQLEELALRVKDAEIADLVSGNKRGMVAGEALQSFVNRQVRNARIEQFKIPFAALATNLNTGEPAVFTSGDAGQAVRASSSIPAVFIPTRINEQEFVDGGLISPFPVRTARELGATTVVGVSLNGGGPAGLPSGLFELLLQSFEIMSASITRLEMREADVVIKPDLSRQSFTDFNSRNLMITLGEQAARRLIPTIKSKMRMA